MPIWVWVSVVLTGAVAAALLVGGIVVAVDARRRAPNRADGRPRKSLAAEIFDGICDLLSQVLLGRWSDV